MKKPLKAKIIFILVTLAIGALSAYLTRDNMNIFDTINKPPLAPPPIVFPIVWTILYTLMGYGAARVYLENPTSDALTVYWINLIINFFWSIIFFNFRNFGLSFIWLVLLFVVVVVMTVKFYRVDKPAGLLQIPYLIWLVIAGYLNLYIYLAN